MPFNRLKTAATALLLAACMQAALGPCFAQAQTLCEDSFDNARLSGWKTYGGDWQSGDGHVVIQGQDGPKALLTGEQPGDFEVTTTVTLKRNQIGEAGLIFRVSSPSVGVDGFRGYYVGVSTDNRVLLGKMDGNGYTEIASNKTPIKANVTYHLKLQVFGNTIRLYVEDAPITDNAYPKIDATEQTYAVGRVGIRSLNQQAEFGPFTLSAYERPVPEVAYQNPIQANGADPVVMHHDGTYYLYCTYTPDWPRMVNGIRMYHSKDLIHWEDGGFVLKNEDSWGTSRYWAPDIVEKDGTFYLYYASDEQMCIATSDSPMGPFKQTEKKHMLPDFIRIDGHVFTDDDGQSYFYFVRFDNGNQIWGMKMNDDMKTVDPSTAKLMVKPDQPWETHMWPVAEGPEILKHEGVYYLTYSGSHFESPNYAVGYATSDSPLGPWEKYEFNPIMKSTTYVHGTAHHTFAPSPDGKEMFIVYHQHRNLENTEPRQLSMDRIRFKDQENGPDILEVWGPTQSPQPAPSGVE